MDLTRHSNTPARNRVRNSRLSASLLGTFGPGSLSRRRALWITLAVVIVPLVVLLTLQYRLLVNVQRNTAVAHRAALQVQLDLVAKQVALHFSAMGEETLRVPPWIFEPSCDCFDKLVFDHLPPVGPRPDNPATREKWLTAPGQGVREFFLIPLHGRFRDRVFAYDLRRRVRLGEDAVAPATRLTLSYWQMRAERVPASVTQQPFVVDDSDPQRPMLLSLVADGQSQLVGLSATVVDLEFFSQEVLPMILNRTLRSEHAATELLVTVWDSSGRTIITDPGVLKPRLEIKRTLASVVHGWTIGLGSRRSTGAEIARSNFVVNVTLSAMLAFVLLAGIVLVMRTADREMKLSEIKNDFVSNVSHELRTPLSSMRVFGELMRLGRVHDPAKVREYGEYIESEGRRLSRLIDNILDFSRIESGGHQYQLEQHDMAEIVSQVLQASEVRLQREGFVVEVEAPDGGLPPMWFDGAAIGHALTNLIDNATKYSGASRRIVITMAIEDPECVVAITDFGIGIPREEHRRIFDRFHRVGTGLVHDVKGSGLGLAIVRHIAEAHGGRVTVESEPGRGSVFALRLPIRQDDRASRSERRG